MATSHAIGSRIRIQRADENDFTDDMAATRRQSVRDLVLEGDCALGRRAPIRRGSSCRNRK